MAEAMTRESGRAGSLRLGHILYSNCFPVHARLIDRPRPGDPLIVEGIPSHLNGLLERGEIDVAPCSSIEFARYADRYRLLPDLVIGSRGPVRSIQFLSDRPADELGDQRVAIPTASATSVVLLKILLRRRWRVETEFFWFDQAREDPFSLGAAAALFIGDVALRPDLYPDLPFRADLGEEWWHETELPFAFAVWQAASTDTAALHALHAILLESRRYGRDHRAALARRHASRFGLPAEMLDSYWADLTFDLDSTMLEGLRTFYRLAADIGEIDAAPELRWI
jgi:chorismate dehydratase